MMKKSICALFVLMLLILPAKVLAEDSQLVEYRGICPHSLCNFGMLFPEHEEKAGGRDCVSAVCEYCEEQFVVTMSGRPATGETSERTSCAHSFRRLPYVTEEGWYPLFNSTVSDGKTTYERVSMLHEYRTYYVAACDQCGYATRMYDGNLVNKLPYGHHELPSTPGEWEIDIHVHETNRHLYVTACRVCGFYTDFSDFCMMYDNGLCAVMLQEALDAYVCDHSLREGQETLWLCPTCGVWFQPED